MFYSNKYPKSVFRELQDFPYSKRNRRAIFDATKGSEDLVQRLKLLKRLPIHNGCVNCICWNEKGNKILSGSDDQHLIITDPFSYKVLAQYRTNHRANIFSAKFLPNTDDTGIVSCCGDGSIFYTDLNRLEETQDCLFSCHAGTTYDVVTIPNDPNVFLSCGEDYTVRSFDLRVKTKCNKVRCKDDVIIRCGRAVTALTINNLMPCQVAIGCADSTARIYDRRMVDGLKGKLSPVEAFIKPGLEKKPYRITSLNFSPEGNDLLVSYSSEHVYLFGLKNGKGTVFSEEEWLSDEEGGSGGWCLLDNSDSVPVRRLRLRGDWSDTGPDARPVANSPATAHQGGRRVVQGGLIQRMTDVLSRMLNDPETRAALSQGGDGEASEEVTLEQDLGEYLASDRGEALPATPRVSESSTDCPVQESTSSALVPPPQQCLPVSLSNQEDVGEETEPVSSLEPSSFGQSSTDDQPLGDTAPPEAFSGEGSPSQLPDDLMEGGSGEPATSSVAPPQHGGDPVDVPTSSSTHQVPSVSSAQDSSALPETSNNSNLTDLSDELSSMFNGFQEKFGKKPMVNLVYSVRGSTASTISMTVEDNLNRPPTTISGSSQENVPEVVPQGAEERMESDETSAPTSPGVDETMADVTEDPLGPSTSSATHDSPLAPSPSTSLPSTRSEAEEDRPCEECRPQNSRLKKNILRWKQAARRQTRPQYGAGERMESDETGAPVSPGVDETMADNAEEDPLGPSTSSVTHGSPLLPPPSASLPSTRSFASKERFCEDCQPETFRLKQANIRMKYTGHRNARTMIKEATFWGSGYVMSGSDCGHVFIWCRDTGRLVMTLQADNHVVNCLQPHPTLPVLATSGIDYDLKLWAPLAPEPAFDSVAAQELMNRNAIMLEETKDTITVPASFMIRMLACLNQLRRGGRAVRRRRPTPD